MEHHRSSQPFGEPAWMHDGVDGFFAEVDRTGRRIEPELFRMLRRLRRVRVRLVVEVVLLTAAVVLVVFIPNLGQIMLASTLGLLTAYDLALFVHLRRRVAAAWAELARDPGE